MQVVLILKEQGNSSSQKVMPHFYWLITRLIIAYISVLHSIGQSDWLCLPLRRRLPVKAGTAPSKELSEKFLGGGCWMLVRMRDVTEREKEIMHYRFAFVKLSWHAERPLKVCID